MTYHVTPLTPRPDRGKISHFENLFRFTQYGCHSFSVDASSDPTKFQDDWPSGSPLIGEWSSDFAFNVFVCQVEPRIRSDIFGRKSIRAKISHFQNLFRFTQYGCHSFSVDASSDPTKFQDDWPSGSPLIGAWSSDFAFNVFVCQVEPRVRSDIFGRKSIS